MSAISKLSPQAVWEIFDQITRVPRPSKKEGQIIRFLENFATEHHLEHKTDQTGNVVIRRPASPSMQGRPVVVLQSHMDMVCEKNSDVVFDFEKDPIQPQITPDGWVKATGTTLGADDGIGMAAALALLIAQDIELPALEALFTVDEETGLTGAFNLGQGMLTGRYLINLDSEDEGELFIGCAGGIDTVARFPYRTEESAKNLAFFRVDITGLTGGHSGDDIEKGRANSNKLLTRLLWRGAKEVQLRLCKFDGGNLRNAIPREAHAVFGVPVPMVKAFFELYEAFVAEAHEEYRLTEPNLDIAVCEMPYQTETLDAASQRGLLYALQGVPNGVLAMSQAMPGLVETSTNLASVKFKEQGTIEVVSSQRSSLDGARFNAAATVESVFELGGGKVIHSDGYPGWNPNPDSHILDVTRQCYQKLFGQEPRVRAIHAGLECGLFLQKYPDLQMVSFGPTLRGVHSPDERLEIVTVEKFWKLLREVVVNL